jgi:hypothetical protein
MVCSGPASQAPEAPISGHKLLRSSAYDSLVLVHPFVESSIGSELVLAPALPARPAQALALFTITHTEDLERPAGSSAGRQSLESVTSRRGGSFALRLGQSRQLICLAVCLLAATLVSFGLVFAGVCGVACLFGRLSPCSNTTLPIMGIGTGCGASFPWSCSTQLLSSHLSSEIGCSIGGFVCLAPGLHAGLPAGIRCAPQFSGRLSPCSYTTLPLSDSELAAEHRFLWVVWRADLQAEFLHSTLDKTALPPQFDIPARDEVVSVSSSFVRLDSVSLLPLSPMHSCIRKAISIFKGTKVQESQDEAQGRGRGRR